MKLNRDFENSIDSNYLVSVFKDGFALLRKYDNLIEYIEGYVENPSSYDNDEGIIFLDVIGELIDLNISNLDRFYINSYSGYQDLKRRLSDGFEAYYKVLEIVTPDYDAFLPIQMKDLERVLRLLKSSYGHLALFLVRQFEMEELTVENFKNTVEFSLENACKDLGFIDAESVLTLRGFLSDKVREYKPKIEIFDEYPELEDRFFEKVGQEFYDLDYLTYDDVINIIEEKLDPDDLKRRLDEASGSIQDTTNK